MSWKVGTSIQGLSGNMTPSSEKMTNFRPCNKHLRVAGGETHSIKGRGNLVIDFQSSEAMMRMELIDVAYVPTLSYHLISISASNSVLMTLVSPCTQSLPAESYYFRLKGTCISHTAVESMVMK